uniref:Uncharacterized protein n=1 Tax=Rhizophora mucronata TaxID=61149 RepID=A0A2P2NAS2_RHIMU
MADILGKKNLVLLIILTKDPYQKKWKKMYAKIIDHQRETVMA